MSTPPDDRSPRGTDWTAAAAALRWIARPTAVHDDVRGPRVEGGRINLCFNALDRHVVAGLSDETALVADVDGAVETWSWARLLEDVAAFAGALRLLGAAPGTPVLVALPPGPETVVSLLACLRLGSVAHLVPADVDGAGFAALVEDLAPPVLLTAAERPWREALELTRHQVGSVVVKQPQDVGAAVALTEPRDLEWGLVARAGRNDPAPCARVAADDPAYAVVVGSSPLVTASGVAALVAAQQAAALRLAPGQVWRAALDPASVPGVVWGALAPLVAGATLVVSDAEPSPGQADDPVAAAHHVTGSAGPGRRGEGGVHVEVRSAAGGEETRTVWWRDGTALPD